MLISSLLGITGTASAEVRRALSMCISAGNERNCIEVRKAYRRKDDSNTGFF